MSRVIVMMLALAAAAPAAAQTSQPQSPDPLQTAGTEFFSRFDFRFGLEHLVSEDPRFVWDAIFASELDLIDYGRGRLTFVATYQNTLGSEFKSFDPIQGNYILGGSASARAGAVEVAGVFHHVSRHLGDRPKRFPVDWNMVGGRVRGDLVKGRAALDGRIDLRGVVQRTFVDYRWELDAETRTRVRLARYAALIAAGRIHVLGVDGSRDRGTQHGVRGEGGIRVDGRGAAVELFVAGERRIDPYQLEFSTATWLTLGFRVVSR